MADENDENDEKDKPIESTETKVESEIISQMQATASSTTKNESVGAMSDAECDQWSETAKERFETAVFTLATFAAAFVVYVCIVYSLSSPPTILHRV
ncbi:uncharacterized protein LOC143351992 [Colletes latitarsis]|uniref:uncharacterized protein LOC143351992 n=1 Tax=Colletes latitarsis TaxID=2605962 RepID=UPI0040353232